MTSSRLEFRTEDDQGTGFCFIARSLLSSCSFQRSFHLFEMRRLKWFLKSEAGRGLLSVILEREVARLAAKSTASCSGRLMCPGIHIKVILQLIEERECRISNIR